MKDYLVRGIVNSKNCRVFACQTTNLLEEARKHHNFWPTASAAMGRMMSATLMMAKMNKNEEKMTVVINGGGPIGTIKLKDLLLIQKFIILIMILENLQ